MCDGTITVAPVFSVACADDRQGCVAGAEQCLLMFEPTSQKRLHHGGQEV